MADREKLTIRSTMEHKRLASVLKNVHADLRKKLRQHHGDFDAVWRQHCQDEGVLAMYAQSMKSLAEDHWTKNASTRIDWCRDTVIEYFRGGGLKKVLDKEIKRRLRGQGVEQRDLDKDSPSVEGRTLNRADDVSEQAAYAGGVGPQQSPGKSKGAMGAGELAEKCDESRAGGSDSMYRWAPAEGRRLRLLDVGSCYNPFQDFEEFLPVGLDLSPACETVHRCDFLRLSVTERVGEEEEEDGSGRGEGSGAREEEEEETERFLQALRSPVEALPGQSFHAVVFSLLLEYLPDPRPRWLCCLQAHRLLRPHGLLLIVTPDSHSQHRNAPMMRSWRTAVEALGFSRWRYVKQEHLHCMAFRKLHQQPPPYPQVPPGPLRLAASTLQIPGARPQDSPPTHPGSDEGAGCPEDLSQVSFRSRASCPEAAGAGVSGDLSGACVDSGFVAKFGAMMYIPQDFAEVGGEGEEEGEEERFAGEEERREFFSAAESELPGFLSEEED